MCGRSSITERRGSSSSRNAKLASQIREKSSRGTRTRRRANGGSLSSRGSATGIQCGLCTVVAGLFRRALCIAGSRRGSGESCYLELASEVPTRTQQTTSATTETCFKSSSFTERVKEVVQEVRTWSKFQKSNHYPNDRQKIVGWISEKDLPSIFLKLDIPTYHGSLHLSLQIREIHENLSNFLSSSLYIEECVKILLSKKI